MTTSQPNRYHNMGFDPDELRDKYLAERDKRIRKDGNEQYQNMSDHFAHYLDDPYVEPGYEREPLTDQIDVAIIGGGFGGMLAGARFQEVGINNFRIIESGGDFGGTWYWNRYPGAQCDIESYCYLPLLEELGYMPKEKYSYAPEIYEHSRRIGETFNLYDKTCFQTKVEDITWQDDSSTWLITTDREDAMHARFVVMACGPLNRPKLPAVVGIEDYKGHTFHTARWDYDYTGGDHKGNLHKLADKRIGVIGTGATAIQSVPFVGKHAKELFVFQRTPSSVDLRGNSLTDEDWAQSLEPGWQRKRRENFNDILLGVPVEEDLVNDGWTEIFRDLMSIVPTNKEKAAEVSPLEVAEMAEMADFKKMNKIRQRVDDTVDDKRNADILKPWYRQFCKRPTFNDEFLPTFNRENVTLVDTSESQGIDRITEKGIVANGVEYELDCIIFATGFEVGTVYTRRAGFEVTGQRGKTLSAHFADGLKTFHGFSSHGFPNCFQMGGLSQTGTSVNLTSVLDDHAQHIGYIIKEVLDRGVSYVQPSEEAESGWVNTIKSLAVNNQAYLEACTPGYYNNEGYISDGGGIGQGYSPGVNAFNALLAQWREAGTLEGMEIK